MTRFLYQEQFIDDMVNKWQSGYESDVRTTIRNLKNKAQASYIAAGIAFSLTAYDKQAGKVFIDFMHPNN